MGTKRVTRKKREKNRRISRKAKKLINKGYKRNQALAIAYEYEK